MDLNKTKYTISTVTHAQIHERKPELTRKMILIPDSGEKNKTLVLGLSDNFEDIYSALLSY